MVITPFVSHYLICIDARREVARLIV